MLDRWKQASAAKAIGTGLQSLYAPPDELPVAIASVLARIDQVKTPERDKLASTERIKTAGVGSVRQISMADPLI